MGFPWFLSRKRRRSPCASPGPQPCPLSSGRSKKPGNHLLPKASASIHIPKPKLPNPNTVASSDSSQSWALPTEEELDAVFRKFDANGDGKISWRELGDVMSCLGEAATEEELRAMVAEADANGDGHIDLSEFIDLNTKGVDSAGSFQDLQNAFRVFDTDGDGCISPHELHTVFNSLGENCSLQDCYSMIRAVDSDGDDSVSFHEFMLFMTKFPQPSCTGQHGLF
eukprot:Gb_15575 [translate_table: standard]